MKKLFIYYSKTGNGEVIANKMAELGYELRKVEAKRKGPKSFFLQMMLLGMLGGMNHKSKLKNYNNDVKDYDEVVIGSPIWNGMLACPINTVLSKTELNNPKFILYAGGGEAFKTEERLKKNYNSKVVVLKEPKKYNDELKKIDELLK